ncbi:hypothetical protein ABPG77_006716 [Micractinium sp. CCAP 211/92]
MTAPALTRAELQAAGRRKLEEFRRQKAAGKAAAGASQGLQQLSSNGVSAAAGVAPLPPSVLPPEEPLSGRTAVQPAGNEVFTQVEQVAAAGNPPPAPEPLATASCALQPLPPPVPQRLSSDEPISGSRGPSPRSNSGLGSNAQSSQELPQLPTANWQPLSGPPQRATVGASAAPAPPPGPAAAAAQEPLHGAEQQGTEGVAGGTHMNGSRGGLFGSFGGLFSSSQRAVAATDGGRPSWLAAPPSSAQETPASPAAQPVKLLPATSSWTSGYAALSDAYTSRGNELPSPLPQQQAGLAPFAAEAHAGHSPSPSGSSLVDHAAAAAAAGASSAVSLPAANGVALPTSAPAAGPGELPGLPGLAAPAAQPAPGAGSAGGGGTAGASPRHSRQVSDAASAASSLLPDRAAGAASAAGGLAASGSSSKLGPSASRAQEFKALQQHIDELTEEKFMLQRAVEHQSKLALNLAEENEALTRRYNEQGAEVQSLREQVEELRAHIAGQVAALDAANAERDAYKLSAQEIQERSKALAAEVVALEEQVLRLKSSTLRDRSEASGATEVARAMQAQLEAVSKERGNLLDEVHRLREESAEARHQLKRTQQQLAAAQQTAAAAAARQQQQPNGEAGGGEGQGDAATGQAVAAAAAAAAEQKLREAQRQHAAELSRLEAELLLVQRQNAELQQRLRAAEAAAAAAARSGGAVPGEREAAVTRAATAGAATPQAGGIDGAGQAAEPVAAGGAASPSGPAVSAAISALAIQEAGAASTAAQQQGQQVQGGLPPELAALLPAALYAGPTADSSADGLPNGQAVLQLSSSIHLLLDALEQEKRQLLAALNAKQEELDSEQRTAVLLEQRLAAQQRKLEVLAQQAQQQGQPPGAVVATRA